MKALYDRIISGEAKIAIIGLGYVGIPLATAFATNGVNVIGFDVDEKKIELYKQGIDPTSQVGNLTIRESGIKFTTNPCCLREASIYIVAVPTPVLEDHSPDLSMLEDASNMLGQYIQLGDVVIYESTVYPGVTEDICIPILEKKSGLSCGKDFKVGYSPERINPGDMIHCLDNVVKLVSATDNESLDLIAKIYEIIVKAEVYKTENIKVAEAAKIIENSQRDINIAFMNEISQIFHHMDIDTKSVIEAASTKWNFLKFYPGLVGGHCIGVDPYYLSYQAEKNGYHSEIIAAGRKVNDQMSNYIVKEILSEMIKNKINPSNAVVGILGITFKENFPDLRNSKVFDIYKALNQYGIKVKVADPVADILEVKETYNISLVSMDDIRNANVLVIAVSHECFKRLTIKDIDKFFDARYKKIIFDIKGILNKKSFDSEGGYFYWRL